jgi:hypothetical protein
MVGKVGLKAGVANIDITPPIGIEISGYGLYINRRSTSIGNRLYSKSLVLSDDANSIAIVANDLFGIDKETTKVIRETVEKKTGIPKNKILLSCTHTHHGPATLFLRACGKINKDYLNILSKDIACGVALAHSKLQYAKIGTGKGNLYNISINREKKSGSIDPEIGVVKIDNLQNKSIAYVINFSCHSVVMPVNTIISSDYPGVLADIIEKVKAGSVGMSLQGACGDINPVLTNTGKIKQMGATLASETLRVEERIPTTTEVTIESKSKNVKLPLNIPSKEEIKKIAHKSRRKFGEKWGKVFFEWAESLLEKLENNPKKEMEIETQLIRIGETILIAQPSEMFVEFCLEVKKRSLYKNTFLVGYANDYIGYIPNEEDYKRNSNFGGYAATMVPALLDNFCFSPNVGRVMTDSLIELIQSLS